MKTKLFLVLILLSPFISYSATFYWVGGSGNWSDYATHWATSSGGNTFQPQVPSSLDDVVFDANSFTTAGQTVTIDQTIAFCKNMDWTGVLFNPSFAGISSSSKIKIFGSLTLNQNMSLPFSGTISFEAMTTGNTIKSDNNFFQCVLEFNGFNGDWSLVDSLTTTKSIIINYGILKTNDNNVQCKYFYSNNNTPGGLLMGSSVFMCTESWTIYNTTFTLDADSSYLVLGHDIRTNGPISRYTYNIIEFTQYSATLNGENNNIRKIILPNGGDLRFIYANIDTLLCSGYQLQIANGHHRTINFIQALSGFEHRPDNTDSIGTLRVSGYSSIRNGGYNFSNFYGNAIFNGDVNISFNKNDNAYGKFRNCTIMGDGNITGNTNIFDTLKLSIGRTYTFGANGSQTIAKWFDCVGDPGFPIQLVSETFGQQATLNILQDTFCSDYLYMRDMKGIGSANLLAGANSNNVYNNSGWVFSSCAVGVDEIENDNSLSIYPNPFIMQTTVEFGVEFSAATNYRLIISDVFGRAVKEIPVSNSPVLVERDGLASGLYFLRLVQENETVNNARLIITD